MTQQRRHGQKAIIYPSKLVETPRQGRIRVVDMDNGHPVKGWVIPQRGSRAEVPGQVDVNVVKMGFTARVDDVDTASRVFWRDQWWDIISPPGYHHGSRHVRHYSVELRERPRGADG